MSKPHITYGQDEDGAYTIHIDGNLRGKYSSPEMMQVYLAYMIVECDRLNANQRLETAQQIAERHGLAANTTHDPVEGLLGG